MLDRPTRSPTNLAVSCRKGPSGGGVVAALIVVVAERDVNGFAGRALLELKSYEFDAFVDERPEGSVVVVGGDGVELFAEMVDQEIAGDDGESGVRCGLGAGL